MRAGSKPIPAKVALSRTSRESPDPNDDETDIAGLAAEDNVAMTRGFEILQRPSNALNTISARISTNLEPVMELVSQIAVASEMNLKISPSAIRGTAEPFEDDCAPRSAVEYSAGSVVRSF